MNYTHYEEIDGIPYKVHQIKAGKKEYLCPGCQGRIFVGESHVVVWTEDSLFGAQAGIAARRHWHTNCWRGRSRRGPLPQRW